MSNEQGEEDIAKVMADDLPYEGDGHSPPLTTAIYASFVLFGIAQLLPWNVYIKSIPYFQKLLSSYWLSSSLASFMSMFYTVGNFTTTTILVILRWDELFMGTPTRVTIGAIGNVALMTIMVGLLLLPLQSSVFFWFINFISIFAGVFTACIMKGLMGSAARFPPKITPAMLGGQVVAGLIVSFANILATILGGGGSQSTPVGAIIYFLIGASLLTTALIVYRMNCRYSATFRHYLGLDLNAHHHSSSKINHHSTARLGAKEMKKIFWRIRWFALGICLNFSVTIGTFAAFVTQARMATSEMQISPVILQFYVPSAFILFDLGDIMGRLLPLWSAFCPSIDSVFILVLPWIRLLFFPLFVFFAPLAISSHSGKTLVGISAAFGLIDVVYGCLIFCLGLSGGYSASVLFMLSPIKAITSDGAFEEVASEDTSLAINTTQQKHGREREAAGAIMGFFLISGVLIGSLFTLVIHALV